MTNFFLCNQSFKLFCEKTSLKISHTHFHHLAEFFPCNPCFYYRISRKKCCLNESEDYTNITFDQDKKFGPFGIMFNFSFP